jgi:chemotaxis protein MotB
LVGEKDLYLNKNQKLLKEKETLLNLKDTQIAKHKNKLSEEERLLALKNRQISENKIKLSENERVIKLKIDEITKLNKMLKEANTRELELGDKIVLVQNMLDENKNNLNKSRTELESKKKKLKDYEGKVVILSNRLNDVKKTVQIKDEKLLTLLNAMDEKKSKYDGLIAKLQSQKAKIKSLTGIKLKVVEALKDALGNKINIDKNTGSLRLASNILFGKGESVLKPEAKVELKKAFEEYIGTLINNKKIKSHLDKIIIEGHTDSDGSYIYNLNLSQKRALAVMEYLVSLDFSKENNIKPLMVASGRAFLDPIEKDGVEDKDASRRIEIKFRLKNEDAMNEIEKVLDAE